jgi:hypothetical protein
MKAAVWAPPFYHAFVRDVYRKHAPFAYRRRCLSPHQGIHHDVIVSALSLLMRGNLLLGRATAVIDHAVHYLAYMDSYVVRR